MARTSFPEDGGLGLGAERQCLGGGRSRRGRDASAGHSGPEREAVKSGRTEAGGVLWGCGGTRAAMGGQARGTRAEAGPSPAWSADTPGVFAGP